MLPMDEFPANFARQ